MGDGGSAGEARQAMQALDEVAQEFLVAGNRLLAVLDKAADLFGVFLRDLRQLIDQLLELLQQAWEKIKPYLKGALGWPWDLWDAGDGWTKDVGARASSLVSAVDAAQMSADDHWQGPARDAYAQAIPQQNKALAAVKAACDDIDDALTTIGWGQIAFAIALAGAIALAIAEYTAETAAAATGVGAPPAAAAAGLTTAQLVTAVAAIVAAFVTVATLVSRSCTDLEQRLDNNDAFVGRGQAVGWPRATADVADPTQWKPR